MDTYIFQAELWCADCVEKYMREFDCARAELPQILYAIRHGLNDGWRVVGCDVGSAEQVNCEHCGRWIA